eukprot:2305425-Amphidinium_carterae.2
METECFTPWEPNSALDNSDKSNNKRHRKRIPQSCPCESLLMRCWHFKSEAKFHTYDSNYEFIITDSAPVAQCCALALLDY